MKRLNVSISNLIDCLVFFYFRFQDASEERDSVDTVTTIQEINREQNNNSMFQENLEIPQENSLINSR